MDEVDYNRETHYRYIKVDREDKEQRKIWQKKERERHFRLRDIARVRYSEKTWDREIWAMKEPQFGYNIQRKPERERERDDDGAEWTLYFERKPHFGLDICGHSREHQKQGLTNLFHRPKKFKTKNIFRNMDSLAPLNRVFIFGTLAMDPEWTKNFMENESQLKNNSNQNKVLPVVDLNMPYDRKNYACIVHIVWFSTGITTSLTTIEEGLPIQ